jgi:hypothetical protein
MRRNLWERVARKSSSKSMSPDSKVSTTSVMRPCVLVDIFANSRCMSEEAVFRWDTTSEVTLGFFARGSSARSPPSPTSDFAGVVGPVPPMAAKASIRSDSEVTSTVFFSAVIALLGKLVSKEDENSLMSCPSGKSRECPRATSLCIWYCSSVDMCLVAFMEVTT